MDLQVFNSKMDEAGDAYIYFRSAKSSKIKYHIGTMEFFASPYTREKFESKNLSEVKDGQVKVFCWDLDNFKNIDVASVVKIVPLQEAMRERDERG